MLTVDSEITRNDRPMRRYLAIIITAVTACLSSPWAGAAEQTTLANGSVLSDTPPAGAPTAACNVAPVRDASKAADCGR